MSNKNTNYQIFNALVEKSKQGQLDEQEKAALGALIASYPELVGGVEIINEAPKEPEIHINYREAPNPVAAGCAWLVLLPLVFFLLGVVAKIVNHYYP